MNARVGGGGGGDVREIWDGSRSDFIVSEEVISICSATMMPCSKC